jgi:hypothetical protein
MDELVYELLYKMEEIQRVKKAKAFYDELVLLEELQTKAVLRLMKARLLIETVVAGDPISKEKLTSPEIKSYKSKKTTTIRDNFKSKNGDLLDDDEPVERYSSKKPKEKTVKKSTVEETYELWQEKMSIKDIANIRKLTTQTIESHLVKLIQTKVISVNDVLPADKIAALKEAFQFYQEESLNGLKEKHGEKFTWDELRMYKASLN